MSGIAMLHTSMTGQNMAIFEAVIFLFLLFSLFTYWVFLNASF